MARKLATGVALKEGTFLLLCESIVGSLVELFILSTVQIDLAALQEGSLFLGLEVSYVMKRTQRSVIFYQQRTQKLNCAKDILI